jgi:hypothetical protein
MVAFHLSKASTLPNRWWLLSYDHNGNNVIIEHLHQGLNPKYTHMVLSDHLDFQKIYMLANIVVHDRKK